MNKKIIITISIITLIALILLIVAMFETEEKFIFNPITNTILGVRNSNKIEELLIPSEIKGVKVKSIKISNGELPNLKKVIIEEGIEIIGENCFYNSKNLKTVVIPKTVKKIEKQAFSKCDQLINITLPNNLEEIGEEAFSECLKLENVYISDNVKTIGKKAFLGTKWVTNLLKGEEENMNENLYKKIIESNEEK